MKWAWLLFVGYGICQVLSVTLIKHALSQVNGKIAHLFSNSRAFLQCALGGCCYGLALLAWVLILGLFPLTVAYPAAVSIAIVTTTLVGVVLFKETMTYMQRLGIVVITGGLILLLC